MGNGRCGHCSHSLDTGRWMAVRLQREHWKPRSPLGAVTAIQLWVCGSAGSGIGVTDAGLLASGGKVMASEVVGFDCVRILAEVDHLAGG